MEALDDYAIRSSNSISSKKFCKQAKFVSLSFGAFAAPDKAKGPKCQYRDLDSNKIISYDCDRFQSKGDIDSITPQMKIVSPQHGDVINYEALPVSGMTKQLPITIVVNSDYVVDFSLASNAGTEYAKLPQEDGVGHAHAYCAPEIEVTEVGGNITDVDFVGEGNRSDFVCGFCVFGACTKPPGEDFQVCSVNCNLQQTNQLITEGTNYRVIVDTTENSHGPRIKHHPRDVPPGDQVIISFENVPVPTPTP